MVKAGVEERSDSGIKIKSLEEIRREKQRLRLGKQAGDSDEENSVSQREKARSSQEEDDDDDDDEEEDEKEKQPGEIK